MAGFVITDAYVNITGPGDISALIQKCTLSHSQAEVDASAMVASGVQPFKARLPGAQDFTIALEAKDDLTATTGLDVTLWALWGTTFNVAFRYHNTAKSTSNPEYSATMMLTSDTQGGSIFDLAKRPLNLAIASGVITRATS